MDVLSTPYIEGSNGERYVFIDETNKGPDFSEYEETDDGMFKISKERLNELLVKENSIEAFYHPALEEWMKIKHEANKMRQVFRQSGLGGDDIEMVKEFINRSMKTLEKKIEEKK